MNLLALRTQVVKQSGRYDLVVDAVDYEDNGMDFHINAGQRWLNKKVSLPRAFAHLSDTLSSGDYALTLTNKFKELSSVTIDDGANPSWTLTYKTLAELKALYDAGEYSTPYYYSYASYRTLETADLLTIANFVALDWPSDEDDRYDYSGIIIVPAADTSYTLTSSGRFLPLELDVGPDSNYWSEEYPELLVMAALRSIALFMGEHNRARYLEEAIMSETGQFPQKVEYDDPNMTDRM